MDLKEKRRFICDFADHLNKSGYNIFDADIDKFFEETKEEKEELILSDIAEIMQQYAKKLADR